MNILVTAGNTLILIDRVRCITNIFTGRTGTRLALHCHEQGHDVTLLTSHPEVIGELQASGPGRETGWTVRTYRTFDELHGQMQAMLLGGRWDVVIHCAAVSDYRAGGIYAPAPNTQFFPDGGRWQSANAELAALVDKAAAKVKSDAPELWLRLVRTPKLVDLIRSQWEFTGILVKFKLEAGIKERQLVEIAESSRRQSAADLMVANTLEEAAFWAYIGPLDGGYRRVHRRDLPAKLLTAVEKLYKERAHG